MVINSILSQDMAWHVMVCHVLSYISEFQCQDSVQDVLCFSGVQRGRNIVQNRPIQNYYPQSYNRVLKSLTSTGQLKEINIFKSIICPRSEHQILRPVKMHDVSNQTMYSEFRIYSYFVLKCHQKIYVKIHIL